MISEAKKRADKKYRAARLHRVALDYTHADYDRVKAAADAAGVPVGTFCRAAIEKAINAGQAEPISEPVRVPFIDPP